MSPKSRVWNAAWDDFALRERALRIVFGLVGLSAVVLLLSKSASAQLAPRPGRAPQAQAVEYKLSNGLRVLAVEDHLIQGVSVAVAYDVGSAHDPKGYRGLAHLVEHLTFRGSRHLAPGEQDKLLTGLGAGNNAFTGLERTIYLTEAPSYGLETVLWIESERMGFALDGIDAEALRLEQKIVSNELSERKQSLETVLWEQRQQLLYGNDHPFTPPADEAGDVNAVALPSVQWFIQSSYRPDNATLVVVGDVEQNKLRGLVEKYFGPLRNPALPRRSVTAPAPKLCGVHRASFGHPFVLGKYMHFTWLLPAKMNASERVALNAALTLIAAELRDILIARSANAVAVDFSVAHLQTHGQVSLEVELHEGADWNLVERSVFERATTLANQPLAEKQFRSLRGELQADDAFGREYTPSRAVGLARGEALDAEAAALDTLTPVEISNAARQLGPVVLITRAAKASRTAGTVMLLHQENPCH